MTDKIDPREVKVALNKFLGLALEIQVKKPVLPVETHERLNILFNQELEKVRDFIHAARNTMGKILSDKNASVQTQSNAFKEQLFKISQTLVKSSAQVSSAMLKATRVDEEK